MNGQLTDVPGVRVGHWTHDSQPTGCTVVVLPEPNVVTVEVRGAAPGSRETALLRPGMRVEQAQAIILSGGSAFGLATADGVMRELLADERGHVTPAGLVPIVPAAVIFDLGRATVRPGPEEGASAYRNARDETMSGPVGAGAGATAAKWRGFDHMVAGGIGTASVRRDDVVVGAIVVVNALGDAFTLEGEPLTGGSHVPGPPAPMPTADPASQNTTLAVVATNASMSRSELTRLAVRGQDAYSVCLRPSHTRYDGDACFAVSCGEVTGDTLVDVASEAAFEAVGRAIEHAIRTSNPT